MGSDEEFVVSFALFRCSLSDRRTHESSELDFRIRRTTLVETIPIVRFGSYRIKVALCKNLHCTRTRKSVFSDLHVPS
jgi:hypothetical protein